MSLDQSMISSKFYLADCAMDGSFCSWKAPMNGFNTMTWGRTKKDNLGPPSDHTGDNGKTRSSRIIFFRFVKYWYQAMSAGIR